MVHILKSQVDGHYILSIEGEMHRQQIRMAKLVGESPCLVAPALAPPTFSLCLRPLP